MRMTKERKAELDARLERFHMSSKDGPTATAKEFSREVDACWEDMRNTVNELEALYRKVREENEAEGIHGVPS